MEKLVRSNTMEMGKGKAVMQGETESDSGKTLSSFVSATTEDGVFGSIRVPKAFHKEFGHKLPVSIRLRCKEGHVWVAEYDHQSRKLNGMEEFMRQHKIKIASLVICDYVGGSDFLVSVYKSSGLETDYTNSNHNYCLMQNNCFDENDYIVGRDAIKEEKALALFNFNAYRDGNAYYKRLMTSYEVDRYRKDLLLEVDMLDLYKNWKDGEQINLIYITAKWTVQIRRINEFCFFGDSWVRFVKEAGINDGDLMVLRRKEETHDVFVCTFKEEDMISKEQSTGLENWTASFFHILLPTSVDNGIIVPPMLATDHFSNQLTKMRKVSCGEMEFELTYCSLTKLIVGCLPLFRLYNVVENDTIFLTLENNGKGYLRIFRIDGMELDYEKKCLHVIGFSHHGYWMKSWQEEKLIDLDALISDEDNSNISDGEDVAERSEFTSVLKRSNVCNKSHGVYVMKEIAEQNLHWNNDTRVLFRINRKTWQVGLNLTNGRVRFCAGWNAFIRDNELAEGDRLTFDLLDDGSTFKIDISRKKKNKKE